MEVTCQSEDQCAPRATQVCPDGTPDKQAEQADMLFYEAELATQLDHRGIMRPLGWVQEDGMPYPSLVMPRAMGGALDHLIGCVSMLSSYSASLLHLPGAAPSVIGSISQHLIFWKSRHCVQKQSFQLPVPAQAEAHRLCHTAELWPAADGRRGVPAQEGPPRAHGHQDGQPGAGRGEGVAAADRPGHGNAH